MNGLILIFLAVFSYYTRTTMTKNHAEVIANQKRIIELLEQREP